MGEEYDCVENGILLDIYLNTPYNPTIYKVEFDDGRKVQTTREHIEVQETPYVFTITNKARTILEVASVLLKIIYNLT